MEMLVIRHAIAVPREEDTDDAARPLTSKGAKRFRRSVRGLRRLGFEVGRVLHSPWQRAAETAELLDPIVPGGIGAALRPTPMLCAPPVAELIAEIGWLGTDGTVAVVGHEPWLGELIATLCFADARGGEGLPLRKGGVAWLEGTAAPGGMVLRAILPPKVMRRIA
jgi:phosphohistidine phosphatase